MSLVLGGGWEGWVEWGGERKQKKLENKKKLLGVLIDLV